MSRVRPTRTRWPMQRSLRPAAALPPPARARTGPARCSTLPHARTAYPAAVVAVVAGRAGCSPATADRHAALCGGALSARFGPRRGPFAVRPPPRSLRRCDPLPLAAHRASTSSPAPGPADGRGGGAARKRGERARAHTHTRAHTQRTHTHTHTAHTRTHGRTASVRRASPGRRPLAAIVRPPAPHARGALAASAWRRCVALRSAGRDRPGRRVVWALRARPIIRPAPRCAWPWPGDARCRAPAWSRKPPACLRRGRAGHVVAEAERR